MRKSCAFGAPSRWTGLGLVGFLSTTAGHTVIKTQLRSPINNRLVLFLGAFCIGFKQFGSLSPLLLRRLIYTVSPASTTTYTKLLNKEVLV